MANERALELFCDVWKQSSKGDPIKEGPLYQRLDRPGVAEDVREIARVFSFDLWMSPNGWYWLLPTIENDFIGTNEFDVAARLGDSSNSKRPFIRALMSYFSVFLYFLLLGCDEYGDVDVDSISVDTIIELFNQHISAYLEGDFQVLDELKETDFSQIALLWTQLNFSEDEGDSQQFMHSQQGVVNKVLFMFRDSKLITISDNADRRTIAATLKLQQLKGYILGDERIDALVAQINTCSGKE